MAKTSKMIVNEYVNQVTEKFSEIDLSNFEKLLNLLSEKRAAGKSVFIAGNGGSASTASHFATDIGIGGLNRTSPVKAISLCDNSAVITASSNDNGYESVFTNQLRTLANPGDLFIAITASGNSLNLINAIKASQLLKVSVFSLTGFDGGKVKELTEDTNLHVSTPLGSYGVVEDLHLSICHMITECLRIE